MARPMKRGANVALTQEIPTLTGVVLGVRWNAGAEQALSDNLVAATILCDAASQAPSDEYFVFFNQLTSPDLSVSQLRRGAGRRPGADRGRPARRAGRDPPHRRGRCTSTRARAQRRTLGQLRECAVRVLDLRRRRGTGALGEPGAGPAVGDRDLLLGELYRHSSGWKFKVIGQGYDNGISGIAADYGVPL